MSFSTFTKDMLHHDARAKTMWDEAERIVKELNIEANVTVVYLCYGDGKHQSTDAAVKISDDSSFAVSTRCYGLIESAHLPLQYVQYDGYWIMLNSADSETKTKIIKASESCKNHPRRWSNDDEGPVAQRCRARLS